MRRPDGSIPHNGRLAYDQEARGGRLIGVVRGHTLIELLVLIAMIVIITLLGAPSLSKSVRDNRRAEALRGLAASLHLARSEAIKRATPVAVAPSAVEWRDGWRVFVDPEGDGLWAPAEGDCQPENDCTLHLEHPELLDDLLFFSSNVAIFNSRGFSLDSAGGWLAGSWTLCDATTPSEYRGLILRQNGQVVTATDHDGDGVREGHDGPLSCAP